MLTEAEAKTKWCAFARVIVYNDGHIGPGNRIGPSIGEASATEVQEAARCIGSGCMAWRWHRASSTTVTQTKSELVVQEGGYTSWKVVPPEGEGWRQIHEWAESKDPFERKLKEPRQVGIAHWARDNFTHGPFALARGYCGLAGQPGRP